MTRPYVLHHPSDAGLVRRGKLRAEIPVNAVPVPYASARRGQLVVMDATHVRAFGTTMSATARVFAAAARQIGDEMRRLAAVLERFVESSHR